MIRLAPIIAVGGLLACDDPQLPGSAAAAAPIVLATPDTSVPDIGVAPDTIPTADTAANITTQPIVPAVAAVVPSVGPRWPACVVPGAACPYERPVWLETAPGFVTRWAVGAVEGKLRKENDPAKLASVMLAGGSLSERVFGDPRMELAEEGKLERRQAAPVFLLTARVHAPEAQDVALHASVNSHAIVALNGTVVLDEDGDQYLLTDHRRIVVHLNAGWNDIAVRLEKSPPYAARLMMRLRTVDYQPVTGLAWDLPGALTTSKAPDVCAAIATTIAPSIDAPDPAGWRITATASARGLVPYPFVKRWSVTRGSAVVAEAALDMHALAIGTQSLVGLLPANVGGGATLGVVLDGTSCTTMAHDADADIRRRLLAAEEHIEGLDDLTLGWGGRDSLRYQALDIRKMLSDPKGQRAARRMKPALEKLERLIADARSGKPPFARPGVHVRAYRSELDGELQRYLVAVPASYAARSAESNVVPLVVLAHGLAYTPEDMLRIAFAKPAGPKEAWASGVTYTWDPPDLPSGAIVVAHDGYGNGGQRPPGEHDVLRVIEEMQAAYRIDPRRISISGFSLGGSVAFWVPFHQPALFAAAAPLCGYPNILDYRTVKAATKRPWEPRLLDEEGVAPYAESGKYLPLKMVHGNKDNPQRSRLIEDRYKKLKYQVELDVPDLGHNVWDYAFEDGTLMRWLSGRKRPAVAPQPVLRSGRYRWTEAYWLRIDRFSDEYQFGELSGKFSGQRLEVTTKNVAALTLVGAELGERAEKPQVIVVDGQNLGEQVVHDGLHLGRTKGGWTVTEAIDRPADGKRPGVEGPLSDVWYGPQIVIYGTLDPAQLEANRLAAERHAMHSPWIDLTVPVKADVEANDADLVGKSVVLIGNAASNALTRKVANQLAAAGITFEAHALVVNGRRFEGDEVGISVIRPSPFDPGRYLVVHAGVGAEGTLSSRYLPELVPDFLVYDSRVRAVFGDRILGRREVLWGGFFDARWRFEEDRPRTGGRP